MLRHDTAPAGWISHQYQVKFLGAVVPAGMPLPCGW
jgi:hypothetical protein